MPEFPIKDWICNSSPKERQIIAGAYLTKLVEKAEDREAIPYYENDELDEFVKYDKGAELFPTTLDITKFIDLQ